MKRLPIWEGVAQLETVVLDLEQRVAALEQGRIAMNSDPIIEGDLEMHPSQRIAKWKGEPITLTLIEWKVVWSLAHHPGYLKSRDLILDILADDGEREDRTVDSHIKRIRRKFEAVDPGFAQIVTVYGSGYKWRHSNDH